jgi:hypothetical protein
MRTGPFLKPLKTLVNLQPDDQHLWQMAAIWVDVVQFFIGFRSNSS